MTQSRPRLIGRPCLSCLGLERPADFSYKESLSEYSGFSDHMDFFTATPLCLCSVNLATDDMQINVWLFYKHTQVVVLLIKSIRINVLFCHVGNKKEMTIMKSLINNIKQIKLMQH